MYALEVRVGWSWVGETGSVASRPVQCWWVVRWVEELELRLVIVNSSAGGWVD
jgi:hypothetical protein